MITNATHTRAIGKPKAEHKNTRTKQAKTWKEQGEKAKEQRTRPPRGGKGDKQHTHTTYRKNIERDLVSTQDGVKSLLSCRQGKTLQRAKALNHPLAWFFVSHVRVFLLAPLLRETLMPAVLWAFHVFACLVRAFLCSAFGWPIALCVLCSWS